MFRKMILTIRSSRTFNRAKRILDKPRRHAHFSVSDYQASVNDSQKETVNFTELFRSFNCVTTEADWWPTINLALISYPPGCDSRSD